MISDREASRVAQPILSAEEETLRGAERELDDIVREYEVTRRDTPEMAKAKIDRAAKVAAVALLAYLLLRRRSSSSAGVDAAGRNLTGIGLGALAGGILTRVRMIPTERPQVLLRGAVASVTDRFRRIALTRVEPSRMVVTPSRIVPSAAVPGRPISPFRITPQPGSMPKPDMAGALQRAREATEGSVERIVAVETWDQANAEMRRAQAVASVVAPEAVREWVAKLDMRTCPKCKALDGKRIPADQDFEVEPPVHPYCRCMVMLTYGAGTR
jgi:SPP1 gp7 family putative phage head morphogenesis protein